MSRSNLLRWTGLAAILAGITFAGIQPIHPPDVLSSVNTGAWSAVMTLKYIMCILFLVGIAGIYVRQAEAAGWLGLAGFLLLGLTWSLQSGFVFTELFVLPLLAAEAPRFVESFLGMFNGSPGEVDIGALPVTYNLLVGVPYMLGGVLFGIATFRAGILPRTPAALLAVAALLTPAAALLPHAIQRFAAVPVGLALAWLGYVLWAGRRVPAADAAVANGSFTPLPTTAD